MRVARMLWMRNAGFGLLARRHQQPHQAHKTPNVFSARAIAQRDQIITRLARSQERPSGKGSVDFPHKSRSQGRFAFGRIMQAGTSCFERSALTSHTEPRMAGINHALPGGDAHRFPQASAKKSRSTVS